MPTQAVVKASNAAMAGARSSLCYFASLLLANVPAEFPGACILGPGTRTPVSVDALTRDLSPRHACAEHDHRDCFCRELSPCAGLQDQEELSLEGADLCGGGTGAVLQQQDLPQGFTLGYAKANGCPVEVRASLRHVHGTHKALSLFTDACSPVLQVAITSELPVCEPATTSFTQQGEGVTCVPGSVTLAPQLVRLLAC